MKVNLTELLASVAALTAHILSEETKDMGIVLINFQKKKNNLLADICSEKNNNKTIKVFCVLNELFLEFPYL